MGIMSTEEIQQLPAAQYQWLRKWAFQPGQIDRTVTPYISYFVKTFSEVTWGAKSRGATFSTIEIVVLAEEVICLGQYRRGAIFSSRWGWSSTG